MTHPLIRIAAVALVLAVFGSNGAERRRALGQEPADGAAAELIEALPRPADLHDDLLPPGSRLRLGTVRLRHGAGAGFVSYLGDGSELLTAGSDGTLRVWDVASGKELRRWSLPSISGGGSSSYSDGVVVVVNHRESNLESTFLVPSPDGQTLATMNYDGIIQLWDTATGTSLRRIRTKGGFADALTFSADGRLLATRGNDQVVRVYDATSGQELKALGKAPPQNNRFYFGRSRSLAFSVDGKTLVSLKVEQDNNNFVAHLVFWDVESGKERFQVKAPENSFNDLNMAFSPDGRALLVMGGNGQPVFYDPTTGKELRRLEDATAYYGQHACFSRDGKVIALHDGSTNYVQLFEVATGKRIRNLGDARTRERQVFFGGEALNQSAAFAPDGRTLALVTDAAAVTLWDLETGKEKPLAAAGHQATVLAAVAPNRQTLLTVAADDTLRQWDARTGREQQSVRLPAGAAYACFSPDGRWLAVSAGSNQLALWDALAGKELHKLKLSEQRGRQIPAGGGGMAFSRDGKSLAVRDYDGTLHVFDTATGKVATQFNVRLGANNRGDVVIINGIAPPLAYSADGTAVALVGKASDPKADPNRMDFTRNNNVIRLWHIGTGKLLREFGTHKVDILALAFSPDGRTLAAATSDNAVTLWETLTGKERGRCAVKEGDFFGKAFGLLSGRSTGSRDFNLSSLTFSADGRTLAAGGKDNIIHLWDVATGKKLDQFKGHQGGVQALAFLSDGLSLASTSGDSTALVWDAATHLKRELPAATPLEEKQLETLWNELAGDNGAAAFQAVQSLAAGSEQSVPWLPARLKPVPAPDPKQIDRLIKDLDSEQFQTRQQAEQEIERLAELAQPALQKVLQGKPTLEMQQRVEKLLERLVSQLTPPAELVQQCRAVEALERSGSSSARQLLEKVAQGASGHRLTREAQGSLQRLTATQP
ncbi:MAG: PQQ-binding-like beta-propeller repeat protein [Planctomycetia bacterium]|nr:PQQ-binding-like beta-propeller repeat protein [Planctomycetia bacterium]